MADAQQALTKEPAFLTGGGEAGRSIARLDWAATPLGAISGWPRSLKTAVALVLRSPLAMTLLWGPEGTLIYNDAYALIAGDRHPAAMGAPVRDGRPDAAGFDQRVLDSVLAGEVLTVRDVEFTLRRNGRTEPAWFTLDCSPVLDDADLPAGVLAVVVETTHPVKADTWLRDERERLRQMFEQSPGFMAMLRGPEHVFELVNPAYLKLIGHRDVTGLSVREALPDIAGQGFYELLDEVYRTGVAHTGAAVPVALAAQGDPTPEQRFVDLVYQPVRDRTGAVVGIFVQGADVTDRVMGDRAARASEARNRQILDSAVDYAIIAFDFDGRITRWNEGATRIFGWTETDMTGQTAARIFTPEDLAAGRLQTEANEALLRGVGNDERWHVRRSGERFWAAGEVTPLHDDSGRTTGFVKVLRDRTEQYLAVRALQESEERLHRAQRIGGVGTFSVDILEDRLHGTREFYRIFGLVEQDSLSPAVVEALVLPEDAALRSDARTRGGEMAPLDVEYRIHRADDGALRWIARRAEYEHDEDGRLVRLVGAVQDITAAKAAQRALEESSAQFKAFAQAMPNHVWTAPASGTLDWFNDRTYQYSGAAPGDLDGGGWARIVHPDDIDAAAALWSACLESGEDYETEFRIRRADGEYRWHLVRALSLRAGPEGLAGRWVGTNTDIHERKLTETASTRDRERIWALSQELMMVCDFQGVVTAVNPAATRMLGWREDEMIGLGLASFLHPDDVATTTDEVRQLSGGTMTLAFENRYRAKDGSYRLLDWTAVPEAGLIHGVARDVTRERMAEDALRQAQKMEAVGQLTGGVAHDFNNLLTVIRTSVDLMRRPNVSAERHQRLLESISKTVTRAARLTGQLLAFARRQALQPVAFDAAQNLASIGDMIGTLVGSRIAVELHSPGQPCIVNADPSQFDTAIINMAVNARDAMDGAGRLTISVRRQAGVPPVRAHAAIEGDFIAVALTDTGSGIEATQLEQIFEPFYTTKAIGLGTGLGLSQVFGFAKQSGGEIQVDSTPGLGTTFTLFLPEAERLEAAAGLADDAASDGSGRGACVLIVEDNNEVAASVEDTLQELGYETVTARSAEAALELLDEDAPRFAVVFSDVVMPGMDGIQLAYELRRRHPLLPVVLSSGYSHVLAQDEAHGFDLLPKPYSLDALSRAVGDAVAKRPARPQDGRRARFEASVQAVAERRDAEPERLAALEAMRILDTEEEAAYDDLTRLAASFFGAPIALISLVDADRQWFKSRIGLQATETPREVAFCAHAIADPEHVLVVNDATADARFAANPLVTGEPGIRFYAGAPLVTASGHALGTLCVIGTEPQKIEPGQIEMLQFLADQVIKRMDQRRIELLGPIDNG